MVESRKQAIAHMIPEGPSTTPQRHSSPAHGLSQMQQRSTLDMRLQNQAGRLTPVQQVEESAPMVCTAGQVAEPSRNTFDVQCGTHYLPQHFIRYQNGGFACPRHRLRGMPCLCMACHRCRNSGRHWICTCSTRLEGSILILCHS